MNKGLNIAILMVCLLCVSLLAFLMLASSLNENGVVDQVRFIHIKTDDVVKEYEFYFVGSEVMEGTVSHSSDGVFTIKIRKRIPSPETENGYIEAPYDYQYMVTGSDKEDAAVTYETVSETPSEGPYERFSQKLFITMLFGKERLLKFYEAVIVAFVAACGGLIIGKAEELWHVVKKKGPEEYPKWEELGIYKKIGGAIIAGAALLLLLFVLW